MLDIYVGDTKKGTVNNLQAALQIFAVLVANDLTKDCSIKETQKVNGVIKTVTVISYTKA